MRRFLFSVLLIIGSFVLQTTLFQALSFGGIVPNLMIVLTASYGFMRGKKAGLLTGFFSGLLCDIFFGPVIGLNALIYMYIGFLSGYAHRICYDDDIKVPVMLAGIGDLLYGLSVYALQFLLRGRLGLGTYLYRIILPEIFYTVILTLIVYRVFHYINYHFMKNPSMKESESIWVLK
jgi:rod shape-determining protein MreD